MPITVLFCTLGALLPLSLALTSTEKGMFRESVSISESTTEYTVSSNGIPDHDYGPFPSQVCYDTQKTAKVTICGNFLPEVIKIVVSSAILKYDLVSDNTVQNSHYPLGNHHASHF